MPGGSDSQGDFMGQFDTNMANRRLIGGKTKLQQFDHFQQALSNAMIRFCKSHHQDVQSLIGNLVEVDMEEPPMPEQSLLEGAQVIANLHISNYQDDMKNWKDKVICYQSNKSAMCSVVIGQCDLAMIAKLQITEDCEANRTDLLFVLKAVQVACISVQDNHSMHVVAHEAI